MNLFRIILIIIFCLSILFINTKEINSFSLPQPYTTDFNIEFIPKYPEANSNVLARIISYSFDVNNSYISWSLNGTTIAQGTGRKTATFKTGDVGSSMSLTVYITTDTNQKVYKTINLKIGEVDLLWQADTYTPAFYNGKAKPLANTPIKVVAIPHGFGKRSKLIYEWQRDYKNKPNASGMGKNSFSFTFSDLFKQETIKVKVSDISKNYSIEKRIVIRAEKPKILFYEENPLLGAIYQEALSGKFSLLEKSETIIRAEPYFFPKTILDLLSYNWTMNNQPIESLDEPNIIGLLVPENTSGESIIKLEINNIKNFLQQAVNSFKVNF